MAARDRSFTVNIIPHDANRKKREWIVSGRRLVFLRVALFAAVFLILAAAVILYFGADELSRNAELSRRNAQLQDSLAVARELNRRLDLIEMELQEMRETRDVIENLATAGLSDD
ncbi:hypothetical protein CSA37_07135 [Candidatus Fermentibacteria bacterium]|nr:MAG: hypothetical protein CSA37_10030 [Candidatus Fermentibacteria bacterium]PIE52331.1 MAG: hypothetical protein CSA37_07135 [Candidatus Fermentibacteria bacterium]